MTKTSSISESMYQVYVRNLETRTVILVLVSVSDEIMAHLRLDNQDGNLVADLNLYDPYHPRTTAIFTQIKIIGTATKEGSIFLNRSLMDLVHFMRNSDQRTKIVFIMA